MEPILQASDVSASSEPCNRPPRGRCFANAFRSVDRAFYAELLKAMARPETALLKMGSDRSLMLGKTGERVTTGHDFYAVFTTTEEFRVVAEGKTIGTIPIDYHRGRQLQLVGHLDDAEGNRSVSTSRRKRNSPNMLRNSIGRNTIISFRMSF